jgi:hypothetical protein
VAKRFAYAERLRVAWWVWLAAPCLVAVAAVELTLGTPRLTLPLIGLFVVVTLGLLWWAGRLMVAVDSAVAVEGFEAGTLVVDDARLPLTVVASVTELSIEERRELLGPQADPLAFVVLRPWIRGSVRIDLDDPADPTPYWVVSTRHPELLIEAVSAAKPARADVSRGRP